MSNMSNMNNMPKNAKCVTIIDDKPFGSYTVGKTYPVRKNNQDGTFEIIDDRGKHQICWWNGLDPDCVWERV